MARVDDLLRHLTSIGGSDLHLAAGLVPRVRLHGSLQEIAGVGELSADTVRDLVKEIAHERQFHAWRVEHDVDFAYSLEGVGRFRVNCFEQHNGPGAVLRLVPDVIVPLVALSLPPAVEKLPHLRSGLVLITGPTGAGKSTTLAAIIDVINAGYTKHIVTIEDPIEFVHAPKQSIFSQREIGEHAATFTAAVRAAMREDADVILIGELRDPETIRLALTAAEMGSLVFATLHTNSAPKTIDRLIDAFPAEEQGQIRLILSETLAAVVAQILLPTVDGAGRVPAAEILLKTPALPNLIRDNSVTMLLSHMQGSRALGMQTLDDSLEQLCQAGLIRVEDALRRARDRSRLEKLLT